MDEETKNNIKKVYEANNFKKTNLHKKVQALHPEITKSHVNNFLKQDYTTQLTLTKHKQEAKGHIVATSPNDLWQFDILDLSRYSRKNDNFRYLLACVDVFTRKAYLEEMLKKNAIDVKKAFQTIIGRAKVKPNSLLSDQDGAFLGGEFGTYINKEQIILNTNALRDHHALGIIDNFAFRIKNILTKGFLNDKNVEWRTKIQGIVDNYNKDETSALGGIAPDKAGSDTLPPEEKAPNKPESPEEKKQRGLRNATRTTNHEDIVNMNLDKRTKNNRVSDLNIGDNVRATTSENKALEKGTDPKWSDQVHKVEKAKGNTITLSNGIVHTRNNLLKVPEGTQSSGMNAIDKEKEATKALKTKAKQKVNPNKFKQNRDKVKELLRFALKVKKDHVEKKKVVVEKPVLKPREEDYHARVAREKVESEAKDKAKKAKQAERLSALRTVKGSGQLTNKPPKNP